MPIPPINDWKPESMRITAFTSDRLEESATKWWKDIVGKEPDAKASKPALGTYTAEGEVDGRRFILNITPGRVDWVFAASASEDNPFPLLDPYPIAIAAFIRLLSNWLKNPTVSIDRIAFGLVVQWIAEDRNTAYKTMAAALPNLKIDIEGCSDLHYQVNRPISSSIVSGLKLNRLCRWSVLQISIMPADSRGARIDSCRCRIEIDCNSEKNWKERLDRHSVDLIEELVSHASTLITDGDPPC